MQAPGQAKDVIVVGAGVGGLAAALDLAARGHAVRVFEKAEGPGGKLRAEAPRGRPIDAGPTVLTFRAVFDELFALAGTRLESALRLEPLDVLARHGWDDGARLDLHRDASRTAAAIGEFAGARDARGYIAFVDDAARAWRALENAFLRTERPPMLALPWRSGLGVLATLRALSPFTPYWEKLGSYFSDPRVRQLFARYSTYVGSSPFAAPATLMLVAHLEREGVWRVVDGMRSLATALQAAASAMGATFQYGGAVREIEVRQGRACGVVMEDGSRHRAAAVIFNGDASALPAGLLGEAARRAARPAARRSLSAITWCFEADASGTWPLAHHNVFFSSDYAAEFAALCGDTALANEPTVYLCAQDRDAAGSQACSGPERFLALVNAPANGDEVRLEPQEILKCETSMMRRMRAAGLGLALHSPATVTTPAHFAQRFPGTGGALYGAMSAGWRATFDRPTSRTAIPGLYLAGGSVHPGAGLPIAALSGRIAAQAVARDLASTRAFVAMATPGGISMR